MKIQRRKVLGVAAAAPVIGATKSLARRPKTKRKPNIVMIVVDDMRHDEWSGGGHPYLQTPALDALASNGTVFENAYHATPLCSPNRACLLTGQYASRHGIIDNSARTAASRQLDLISVQLQKNGYRTAHIGKWHMGNDPTPRPGYDYWVCLPGQGKANNSPIFENGKIELSKGHVTDVLTDRAIRFVENADERPFFCYIGHKAIHPDVQQLDDGGVDFDAGSEFRPAPRHFGRYNGKSFPRATSFGVPEDRTKPVVRRLLSIKDSPEIKSMWKAFLDPLTSDHTIQRRAEMMLAVDEGIGRLVGAVRKSGDLENTIFILTSDNGYFFGEHGLSIERRLPYQEAIRAPLIVSGANVQKGPIDRGVVSSIDIPATILDLAGCSIPNTVQGVSVRSTLTRGARLSRKAAYVEYYSHEIPMPWTVGLDYRCLIDDKYKLIVWLHHEGVDELYNIKKDPNEMNNIIQDPRYANMLARMRARLRAETALAFDI